MKAGKPEDKAGERNSEEETLPEQWDVRPLPADYNACQAEVQMLSQ